MDLLTGRRPMSDYDQVVKEWLNAGGAQVRNELQQIVTASK
jgi:hypothetical protein